MFLHTNTVISSGQVRLNVFGSLLHTTLWTVTDVYLRFCHRKRRRPHWKCCQIIPPKAFEAHVCQAQSTFSQWCSESWFDFVHFPRFIITLYKHDLFNQVCYSSFFFWTWIESCLQAPPAPLSTTVGFYGWQAQKTVCFCCRSHSPLRCKHANDQHLPGGFTLIKAGKTRLCNWLQLKIQTAKAYREVVKL